MKTLLPFFKTASRLLLALVVLAALSITTGCGSSSEDRDFLADAGTPSGGGTSGSEGTGGSNSNETVDPPESSNPQPTPKPTPAVSSSVVSRFIWKPESERDGKLVVLVNPTNVRVVVTGDISETLSNSGPSNGFGTTARGSFGGCSYGNSVLVEFFDSQGRRVLVSGGRSGITVPEGCKRAEFG
jgi:hypothetical protein